MFWNRQEEVSVVKNTILNACNPGEKAALEFLEQLDKLKTDYQGVRPGRHQAQHRRDRRVQEGAAPDRQGRSAA
jgi:hypothetical protein